MIGERKLIEQLIILAGLYFDQKLGDTTVVMECSTVPHPMFLAKENADSILVEIFDYVCV